VEKDRNIETKARMVENLQGQSPTEQGCFYSGTRPLPNTPVSSPAEKKRKNTEEELEILKTLIKFVKETENFS